MSLHVQPPNFISQLRVAQVQNPQMLNNNKTVSPYLPGLTPDNPNKVGAWPAHDYSGVNGMPMHMPAFNGRGFTPAPIARPLPMPPLYTFNKLQRL